MTLLRCNAACSTCTSGNIRDLTNRPKTATGKALRALSKVCTADDAARWSTLLAQFHSQYKDWLNERTYARDDPDEARRRGKDKPTQWWYTHDRDRRVYYHLERLAKQELPHRSPRPGAALHDKHRRVSRRSHRRSLLPPPALVRVPPAHRRGLDPVLPVGRPQTSKTDLHTVAPRRPTPAANHSQETEEKHRADRTRPLRHPHNCGGRPLDPKRMGRTLKLSSDTPSKATRSGRYPTRRGWGRGTPRALVGTQKWGLPREPPFFPCARATSRSVRG